MKKNSHFTLLEKEEKVEEDIEDKEKEEDAELPAGADAGVGTW